MEETRVKVCKTCKEEKQLNQFGRDREQPDGLNKRCLSCCRRYDRASRSRDHVKARKKERESSPEYRAKEKVRKARYLKQRPYMTRPSTLRRFGLTPEQYLEMLEKQGGVCAICGKAETVTGKNGAPIHLAVDHDHETGNVRGLLCRMCNIGLGYLEGDIDFVEAAMRYRSLHRQVSEDSRL